MKSTDMPLTGPPPPEVPLKNPPLVLVLAQVRFPPIMAVQDDRFVAPFQEAIRKDYPDLRSEQGHHISIDPLKETINKQPRIVRRFYDVSEDWKVTLSPDFLSLETSRYTSRKDFLQRFEKILEALEKNFNPGLVNRIGVRYIDQISGEKLLKNINSMIKPEISGILSTPLGEHARHSISDNMFELPGNVGHVIARWGLLPAHATVDPAVVKPLDEASWLLDVDAFKEERLELNVDVITEQAQIFAERIYSIFRWAVTDRFLRHHGGKPQ